MFNLDLVVSVGSELMVLGLLQEVWLICLTLYEEKDVKPEFNMEF